MVTIRGYFGAYLFIGVIIFLAVASSAQAITLNAAAGGTGGGWYLAFSQIAQLIKEKDTSIDIKVIPGAGLANPPRLDAGEVQLGFAFPPFITAASKGKDPYDKAQPNIRTVAVGFGMNPAQFMITQDTGVTSIDDLIKKKFPLLLAGDRVGTTDEWTTRTTFEYYKITYDDIKKWGGRVMHLGYGDIETQIKDRNANATFVTIAPPASLITSIAINRPVNILPFSKELQEYFIKEWSFAPAVIKGGTYRGQDKDVETVALFTAIMVHKDVPEDVVYKITKIINENPDRIKAISPSFIVFDPARAGNGTGGTLHPGAEKFYKEKGWLK